STPRWASRAPVTASMSRRRSPAPFSRPCWRATTCRTLPTPHPTRDRLRPPGRGEPQETHGPTTLDGVVGVPRAPGALVWLDVDRRPRDPDDLDDLIDELLPDVDDPPGWFDVGLIGVGAGLLLWVAIGSPPPIGLRAGTSP